MENIAISKEWYNEIKDLVKTANPYEYEESMIEVDVDIEEFVRVSTELGWMI